jgi:chaperonin GroES
MTIEFKPLSNNILIDYEVKEEKKTKGGILLTDYGRQRPQQGIAVAVGPGKKSQKTGERLSMKVKVGDEVKFAAFAGHEIKVEGKEYFLMPETDIQGIIEKDEQGKG